MLGLRCLQQRVALFAPAGRRLSQLGQHCFSTKVASIPAVYVEPAGPFPDVQFHQLPNFELLFLGSGASSPNRFKCPACGLLDIGKESFLFDAGEGALRQSIKTYNVTMMSVTRIFITHMHADHILGLPSILLQASMLVTNAPMFDVPIHIYGPPGLHAYLQTVIALTQSMCHRPVVVHELEMRPADLQQLTQSNNGRSPWRHKLEHYRSPDIFDGKVSHLQGGSTFERRVEYADETGTWTCCETEQLTVKARLIAHKIPCFGFVVQERPIAGELDAKKVKAAGIPLNSSMRAVKLGGAITCPKGIEYPGGHFLSANIQGRKLTVLGDTSNAKNIIELARDSDVVVHESSFDADGEGAALSSGHATPRIAASFALKAKAKRLIINHIGSQFVSTAEPPPVNGPIPAKESVTARLVGWKFDTDVQDELRRALGRPEHCVIARDFMSVTVPPAGYRMDNDDFKLSFYMADDGKHTINKLHKEGELHNQKFSPGTRNALFSKITRGQNNYSRRAGGEQGNRPSQGGGAEGQYDGSDAYAETRYGRGRPRFPRQERREKTFDAKAWGLSDRTIAEAPASDVRSVLLEHKVGAIKGSKVQTK